MSEVKKISETAAQSIDVVIMAAGKGTRMKSSKPKVLHHLAGRALLAHVVDTAASLKARQVVVVTGHGAIEVEASMTSPDKPKPQFDLVFVRQEPQLGTGHAMMQAAPVLAQDGLVVVLSGDVPLLQASTLRSLIDLSGGSHLALLTIHFDDPRGYGRIVRERADGPVLAIVEHKDATTEQQALQEVYSGIMVVPAQLLKGWLARLDNCNSQGEYYLTDIVKLAVADGTVVLAHCIDDALQVTGINSPAQLAALERAFQLRQAQALMTQGVRLADPNRLDVRGELICASDVEIDINCVFQGRVELGEGVRIGANCHIAHAQIEAGAVIQPFCHIEGSAKSELDRVRIGAGASIGPFARLRPGAHLGQDVHIGNFVEIKNASLAKGAKANHLAYVGDARLGERVNYGAGSITANYDGANKHTTVIEDDVHIGSNCVLIAPVVIGAGGTVGGGSTITKDTPAGALTVARAKQVSLAQWKRPKKK
jgi:bifunctional UDP-N-acetylglucosamine pyrophosphorylase / glucosamine-1-phosphate N-acetyltransferase